MKLGCMNRIENRMKAHNWPVMQQFHLKIRKKWFFEYDYLNVYMHAYLQ